MNKGEFENRDRDELGRDDLGDLPRDLARERGEAGKIPAAYGDVPADQLHSGDLRASLKSAGFGGPIEDFTIRSTYDVRPVHCFDFNQFVNFNASQEGGAATRGYCLQVPQGRVAVLRHIGFFLAGGPGADAAILPANTFTYDIGIQILRNNGVVSPINMEVANNPSAAVSYYNFILVKAPQVIDTFLIFDEGETIGLNVLPNSDQGDDNYVVQFEGNLLLKSGVPSYFEIANKGAGKPTSVAASASDVYGPPATSMWREPVKPKTAQTVAPQVRRRRQLIGPMR